MRKAVPAFKQVRLICAGRELSPEDPLYRVSTAVMLCMISDAPLPQPLDELLPQQPAPPTRLQRLLDWLDTVDPAVVLMWAFGIILAIAWLTLLVLYPTHANRNSITVLYMMTVVLIIPCGLSYSMFSSSASRQRRNNASTMGTSESADGPYGGMVIPPRPHAQVRGVCAPVYRAPQSQANPTGVTL